MGQCDKHLPDPKASPEKRAVYLSYLIHLIGDISGVCNHAGGPLGQGKLDGNYVVCPWHNWKFHSVTGIGEPGSQDDAVPGYRVKVKSGRVLVRMTPATPRKKKPHAPHPLARSIRRKPGPVRVVGISATAQDPANPRYSTSEALLEVGLARARGKLRCPTKLLKQKACSNKTVRGGRKAQRLEIERAKAASA